jgi:membrane fusion protein (multidrug efflux system)
MADTQTKESQASEQKPQDSQFNDDNKDQKQKGAAEEAKSKKRKPFLLIAGVVIGVLALFFGIRAYLFNRVHVSTDDAYVTGDLVNVSPQISGTLNRLFVQEGDHVKKGELIALIDPSGPVASLRQAQANYEAAMSQVPAAKQNLSYQKLSTEAAVKKAQSALESSKSKEAGAQAQVSLTSGTFSNQIQQSKAQVKAAAAQYQQSQSQVLSSKASRDTYSQAVQTAQDAQSNYEQQIVTAQRALDSSYSRAEAAAALAQKAVKDLARMEALYAGDAVSAQSLDQARATAQNAAAQLQAAQADAKQSASQVESAKRAASQAQSQVEQAKKSVLQADAQVAASVNSAKASAEQVKVAQASLGVAEAGSYQLPIEQSNLNSVGQMVGEAEADVAAAQSGQAQVNAREEAVKTAQAQAAQAKAAYTNAEITLNDTKIWAPTSGDVVRKDSNEGSILSPGSTIVTLSEGTYVWVTANFKETQLADVRPGEPAEVEVDAFPGVVFKGHVRDITAATGSSTALLPPDNATGNFTKVVQRVPVRIELVPASQGDDKKYGTTEQIDNLKQGMSVTATIDTSHKDDFNSNTSGQSGPARISNGDGKRLNGSSQGGGSPQSGMDGTGNSAGGMGSQGQANPGVSNGSSPGTGDMNGTNPGNNSQPNPSSPQPMNGSNSSAPNLSHPGMGSPGATGQPRTVTGTTGPGTSSPGMNSSGAGSTPLGNSPQTTPIPSSGGKSPGPGVPGSNAAGSGQTHSSQGSQGASGSAAGVGGNFGAGGAGAAGSGAAGGSSGAGGH